MASIANTDYVGITWTSDGTNGLAYLHGKEVGTQYSGHYMNSSGGFTAFASATAKLIYMKIVYDNGSSTYEFATPDGREAIDSYNPLTGGLVAKMSAQSANDSSAPTSYSNVTQVSMHFSRYLSNSGEVPLKIWDSSGTVKFTSSDSYSNLTDFTQDEAGAVYTWNFASSTSSATRLPPPPAFVSL